MKFQSLRKSLTGGAIAVATAVLLAACGGGGAANDPLVGGQLSFLPVGPAGGTIYAGMPVQVSIAGGRRPYALNSSDPGLIAVPSTLNGNTFTIIGNNPGVVDSGLSETDLPRRTAVLSVRDSLGLTATTSISVGQNFLTGYGVFYTSNCPDTGTGGASAACAGGETLVRMTAVFNGSLAGNRQFRFEVLRGPISFLFPGTQNTGNSVLTTSDHTGLVTAIMRVAPNVATQIAVFRVIDVATGVYAEHAVLISQPGPTSTITAIPDEITFTGALSTECGTGIADFLVFDGVAPYTAVSSSQDIIVTRIGGSGDNPGRFQIRANNPGVCITGGSVIVTDSTGARTVVEVTTERGDTDPTPPPDLAVAPASFSVTCGTSGSATVVGGSGQYSVNSSHPRVRAVVSGSTVTVTRLTGDGASTFPTTATITVTDGATIESIAVTVPANCP